jgi:hypothetical protein
MNNTTTIIAGLAPAPFTVRGVGNPSWWHCPKCQYLGVQAIWRDTRLYGFRCLRPLGKCEFEWHYTITAEGGPRAGSSINNNA